MRIRLSFHWFTADGEDDDKYFYYDKEYGTLIGYPTSYDSDKQVNDHHFHYGYWIKAAAAVAAPAPAIDEESYAVLLAAVSEEARLSGEEFRVVSIKEL